VSDDKTIGWTSAFPHGALACGLTKREYFAACAMQGWLHYGHSAMAAKDAVAYADALIEALNAKEIAP
jgi:hypothetical protein